MSNKIQQTKLFEHDNQTIKPSGPLECLGMTFEDDDARRACFIEKLKAKLKDPEFRKIEGFPIGTDEDILALSDPPYYTACPNPFIEDFIKCYGKPYDPNVPYKKEPFATDVSEGKNDPIYNAHSYHTKAPHKAIMRYILHYTKPGDLVFDGFCGTGMTGVAAQICGDSRSLVELGYSVGSDGSVKDSDGNKVSELGSRAAILSDLSPVASFISANYAQISQWSKLINDAVSIVEKVEAEYSWLYSYGNDRVLSAIWSDVFICPNCSKEFVFFEAAVSDDKMRKVFPCPNCSEVVGKSSSKADNAVKLERAFEMVHDRLLEKPVRLPKFVLVEQTVHHDQKRLSINITEKMREKVEKQFEGKQWPQIPDMAFFPGRQTNKLINGTGIQYVRHMYTPRALFAFGALWQASASCDKVSRLLRFCLGAINNYVSRKQGYFGGGGGVSGTLFTPSIHLERNLFDVLKRKISKLGSFSLPDITPRIQTTTQSITDLRNISANTIDYIFTDPPFGESLQYCELNLFVEAWLKVRTKSQDDCVLNYVHKKDLQFYTHTMSLAFREYTRILKPGRWITIEFHNSQNAVWSAIQQAMESAGLVVADVRILDKKQRSFNAVNRAGAVDQDLVISAYKPNGGLEERFKLEAGVEDGVWDFVRTHLRQLPVFVSKGGKAEIVTERQNYLLFDRMVAFHVQRGVTVPLSATEFYKGLIQRFSERDGMFFLPEHAAEYDKKRSLVKDIEQLSLFVSDEASAIQWIHRQLTIRPQTAGELKPQFMQEIGGWDKNEKMLELDELLVENFLKYDGTGEVPSQIHAYLSSNFKDFRKLKKDSTVLQSKAKDRWYVPDPNKASDIEKMRDKALMKEFWDYLPEGYKPQMPDNIQVAIPGLEKKESVLRGKKLKIIRMEAVRAGFKFCWQNRDYKTIIAVAQRIPEDVLQEDQKMLMWYDQALTRMGGE
jgi:hypothetical protein